MNVLRGALIFLAQLIITPIVLVLMMLAIPLGGRVVFNLARAWCGSMVLLGRLLGIRHELVYEGEKPAGAAVVLSKHSSAWETFFIVSHFAHLAPVVKRELLWVPFFGWGLALCRPIAINRSARREARAQLQDQGVDRLQRDMSIMIFPEGTRIPPGKRGRYATGGVALAMAANAPVLAMAHDAGFFWRKALFDKRAGVIRVRFSAPLYAAPGETAIEFNRRIEDWIESTIESFGHAPAERTPAAQAALAAASGSSATA